MRPPDSRAAREAEELLREAAPPFLANHSHRSYAWAVALAARERLRVDEELLYVAALLHDVGLISRFDTGRCFELDGADVARRFAAEQGWTPERAEAAAEAIRLHVAAEIAVADGPEAYVLNHATGFDVRGHRWGDVDGAIVAAVLAAHPRLDFEPGFTELLRDQAGRKPGCWAHEAIERGIADEIAASPFTRA